MSGDVTMCNKLNKFNFDAHRISRFTIGIFKLDIINGKLMRCQRTIFFENLKSQKENKTLHHKDYYIAAHTYVQNTSSSYPGQNHVLFVLHKNHIFQFLR